MSWAPPRAGVLLLSACLILLLLPPAAPAINYATAVPPSPAPDLSTYPWFFQRDAEPAGAEETAVELLFVGDIFLGRGVAAQHAPLALAAPWLQTADLAVGNLEGVIHISGLPGNTAVDTSEPVLLTIPPFSAAALAAAGFDLLSLANNHTLDAGPAGLQQTIQRLQRANILPLPPSAPRFLEVNEVTIAFLPFNFVPDPTCVQPACGIGVEDAARAVAAARRQATVVVALVHWGYEYQLQPDPAQEATAVALLNAGADLIVGHHPHVAQPLFVEWDTGRIVAYSLGNFVFDQFQEATQTGLALRVIIDQDGIRAAQALPLAVGTQPRLLGAEEGAMLLDRVLPRRPPTVFACSVDNCLPAPTAASTLGDGLFWSGIVDLTGDGRPELVRRAGERVIIYEGETAVWHSPSAWLVTDLALGDPNNDGRFELLLAIRQPDGAGVLRSQPYIVGHRQGRYQLIWGGRPVSAPILAVELADTDGDSLQELVVLESSNNGRTAAVWRWQGWHFSLVWRSPSGDFQNLLTGKDENGQSIIILLP